MLSLFKKKSEEQERRLFQRFDPEEVCLLEFVKEGQATKRLAELRDISLEGVRFATPLALSKNSEITLYLYLPKNFPGERQLVLDATVVRVIKPKGTERFRIGCRVHHTESSREKFQQVLYWFNSVTSPIEA